MTWQWRVAAAAAPRGLHCVFGQRVYYSVRRWTIRTTQIVIKLSFFSIWFEFMVLFVACTFCSKYFMYVSIIKKQTSSNTQNTWSCYRFHSLADKSELFAPHAYPHTYLPPPIQPLYHCLTLSSRRWCYGVSSRHTLPLHSLDGNSSNGTTLDTVEEVAQHSHHHKDTHALSHFTGGTAPMALSHRSLERSEIWLSSSLSFLPYYMCRYV